MKEVIICGICGRMGQNVLAALKADGSLKAVCGVDPAEGDAPVPVYKNFENVPVSADVVIDFSSPAALKDELGWAVRTNTPVVLAATGYSPGQLGYIAECAKHIPIFKAANFSLGINLLQKLVKTAASVLGGDFDIEIVEKHHRLKADAPSGTALALAESANSAFEQKKPLLFGREGAVGRRGGEIGIHAVRGGTITGEHEVIFAGTDEVITLSHSAQSRTVFASGAVKAAKWLCGKPCGLYGMDDLLDI